MTGVRGTHAAVVVTALAGAVLLAFLSFLATEAAFLTGCDENHPSAPEGVCGWLDEGGGAWQLPLLAALVGGGGAILAARLRSGRVAWLAIGLALVVGALLPLALTR
jgi:hypothetical protein